MRKEIYYFASLSLLSLIIPQTEAAAAEGRMEEKKKYPLQAPSTTGVETTQPKYFVDRILEIPDSDPHKEFWGKILSTHDSFVGFQERLIQYHQRNLLKFERNDLEEYKDFVQSPADLILWANNSINKLQQNINGANDTIQNLIKNIQRKNPYILYTFFENSLHSRLNYLCARYQAGLLYAHGPDKADNFFCLTTPEMMNEYALPNRMHAQNAIDSFEFLNLLCKQTYDYFQMLNLDFSPLAQAFLKVSPVFVASLENRANPHPVPDLSYRDANAYLAFKQMLEKQSENTHKEREDKLIKMRREEEAAKQYARRQEAENEINRSKQRRREEDRKMQEERKMQKLTPKSAKTVKPESSLITPTPMMLDSFVKTKDEIDTLAPLKKEKIKTKGTPDLSKARKSTIQEEQAVDQSSTVPEPLPLHPIKYLNKKRFETFRNLWGFEASVTYPRFVKMFKKLGGIVDESTASSHIVLSFVDSFGVEHTDGTWNYHGSMDEFDHRSIRSLRKFLTECGLTQENVYYKEDKEAKENKENNEAKEDANSELKK